MNCSKKTLQHPSKDLYSDIFTDLNFKVLECRSAEDAYS